MPDLQVLYIAVLRQREAYLYREAYYSLPRLKKPARVAKPFFVIKHVISCYHSSGLHLEKRKHLGDGKREKKWSQQ